MADDEVKVEELSIEPNNCPLEERLALSMKFVLPRALPKACWRIRFIADQTNKRKIIGEDTRQPVQCPVAHVRFPPAQSSAVLRSRTMLRARIRWRSRCESVRPQACAACVL